MWISHIYKNSLSKISVFNLLVCFVYFPPTGDLGKAPDAVTDTLPTVETPELEGATGGHESEEDVTEMQARLEALRSWGARWGRCVVNRKTNTNCCHIHDVGLIVFSSVTVLHRVDNHRGALVYNSASRIITVLSTPNVNYSDLIYSLFSYYYLIFGNSKLYNS